MKKRYVLMGLLVLLLAVALTAVACGGGGTTTTTAATTTTGASTETTAGGSTTTGASTETTAGGSTTTGASTATTAAAGPATGEPIKIGFSASLTGSGAAAGNPVSQGVALQVDYLNAHGGINGRPLQIIELDDKTDLTAATNNTTKLITSEKVFAIIGPSLSFMTEAARKLAEDNKVPMVGTGPVSQKQIEGTKYVWSVVVRSPASSAVVAIAKVVKEKGWKNILAMCDVLPFNNEEVDQLAVMGKAQGFTVTKMPDLVPANVTDIQPFVNRIMDEYNKQKPDAVMLWMNNVPIPALCKGLKARGLPVPMMTGRTGANASIFGMGPEAVEGLLAVGEGGALNVDSLPNDFPGKAALSDFKQAAVAKYGEKLTLNYMVLGADLVNIVKAAFDKAGGEVDRAKFQEALVNLTDVQVLAGKVTYTPENTSTGIATNTFTLWQVKNGNFEYLELLN